MILTKSQLREWCESPVSEALRQGLKAVLDDTFKKRADFYILGEPQRTQEARAWSLGEEGILKDMLEILDLNDDTGVLERYFEQSGVEILEDEKEENGE